jgi:hypothetical protein
MERFTAGTGTRRSAVSVARLLTCQLLGPRHSLVAPPPRIGGTPAPHCGQPRPPAKSHPSSPFSFLTSCFSSRPTLSPQQNHRSPTANLFCNLPLRRHVPTPACPRSPLHSLPSASSQHSSAPRSPASLPHPPKPRPPPRLPVSPLRVFLPPPPPLRVFPKTPGQTSS